MPEVILLNEIDEVKKHLASNQLAVVNVSATWCGPCRALAPHFNQLASENDNVAFCKGLFFSKGIFTISLNSEGFQNFHFQA